MWVGCTVSVGGGLLGPALLSACVLLVLFWVLMTLALMSLSLSSGRAEGFTCTW